MTDAEEGRNSGGLLRSAPTTVKSGKANVLNDGTDESKSSSSGAGNNDAGASSTAVAPAVGEPLLPLLPVPPLPASASIAPLLALPLFSQYLLFAATLASLVPPKDDAIVFPPATTGGGAAGPGTPRRRARHGSDALSSTRRAVLSAALLGAKPFPVERLLTIFQSISRNVSLVNFTATVAGRSHAVAAAAAAAAATAASARSGDPLRLLSASNSVTAGLAAGLGGLGGGRSAQSPGGGVGGGGLMRAAQSPFGTPSASAASGLGGVFAVPVAGAFATPLTARKLSLSHSNSNSNSNSYHGGNNNSGASAGDVNAPGTPSQSLSFSLSQHQYTGGVGGGAGTGASSLVEASLAQASSGRAATAGIDVTTALLDFGVPPLLAFGLCGKPVTAPQGQTVNSGFGAGSYAHTGAVNNATLVANPFPQRPAPAAAGLPWGLLTARLRGLVGLKLLVRADAGRSEAVEDWKLATTLALEDVKALAAMVSFPLDVYLDF